MGKMLESLGKAMDQDDSTKNKISAEMGKTDMSMIMNGETTVSRPDMAVTSYYKYESTSGNLFGLNMKDREMLLVRVIK